VNETFYEFIIFDGPVKGRKAVFSVIPAKVPRQARDPELVDRAGIQVLRALTECLDPGFHRG